jgi:hypothetical protein
MNANSFRKMFFILILIEISLIVYCFRFLIEGTKFNLSDKFALTKGKLFTTDYSYFDNIKENEIPSNCPDLFVYLNDSILFLYLKTKLYCRK